MYERVLLGYKGAEVNSNFDRESRGNITVS
jgi:hypothetical protein